MSKYILIADDEAKFDSDFNPATVQVKPGKLKASGKWQIAGKAVCLAGDELKVSVPGCTYTTKQHTISGTGTLFIQALGSDQQAQKTKDSNKPVLLQGSTFTAKFMVLVPAQQPSNPNPIPDTTLQYIGTGKFETNNDKVQGN